MDKNEGYVQVKGTDVADQEVFEAVPLIIPLTPELNPSAQTLPAEIFNWGF
jgi:hypothetical protein